MPNTEEVAGIEDPGATVTRVWFTGEGARRELHRRVAIESIVVGSPFAIRAVLER